MQLNSLTFNIEVLYGKWSISTTLKENFFFDEMSLLLEKDKQGSFFLSLNEF